MGHSNKLFKKRIFNILYVLIIRSKKQSLKKPLTHQFMGYHRYLMIGISVQAGVCAAIDMNV